MKRRILVMALAVCVLFAAGCMARPGTNAPENRSHSSKTQGDEASKKAKKNTEKSLSDDEQDPEPEDDEASKDAAPIDTQSIADKLLEEGIVEIVSHYNGDNFDSVDKINTPQMLFSIFRLSESQPGYKAETPDYPGYMQLSKKKVDKLAERWYGSKAPQLEGKPHVLGDATSGELVNVDLDKGTYYFLDIGVLPQEEFDQVVSAKESSNAGVTLQFDTKMREDGAKASRYVVKLEPSDDGTYYIVSMNRGKSK